MKKNILIILSVLVLLILGVGGYFSYSEYGKWTHPWGKSPGNDFLIDIEEGKTARDIANMLVEKKVLHRPTMFLIMADLRGFAEKLKAGEYKIYGASSPLELLDMFATGYNYRHRLVVPEGWTQTDIAKRCEELQICTRQAFLDECQQRNSVFSFVIVQAPGGANAACEGILYPDTYEFIKSTPPERIVTRMMKRYEDIWKDLLAEVQKDPSKKWWWQDDSLALQKKMHNILVLASIVEKEVPRDEDRPLVASVFVNRLKKNMPLQSDSTIHYILQDWSSPLRKSDLEIDSPYNTYKNVGLPAAAICNPSSSAIRAVLMPADTTYLYFLTTNNGEVKFSSTYEEHVKLKQALLRARSSSNSSPGTNASATPETNTNAIQ